MTVKEAMALRVPDIKNSYPMNKIITMMNTLENKYGYVEGDINWSGLLNTALDLRGQAFMLDYFTNPELVKHLLDVILETTIQTVNIREPNLLYLDCSFPRVFVIFENPNIYQSQK